MPKNPHAVALGRKGGRSTSEAKKNAVRQNVAKAREALSKMNAMTCTDCNKTIKPAFVATCPACKTPRCFKCLVKHVDDKVCEYGNAKVLNAL